MFKRDIYFIFYLFTAILKDFAFRLFSLASGLHHICLSCILSSLIIIIIREDVKYVNFFVNLCDKIERGNGQ